MNDQPGAIASPTPLAVDDDNNKDDVSLSTTAVSSLKEDLAPRFQWTDTYFSNEDDIIAVFDLDYPRADSFMFFLAWFLFLAISLTLIYDASRKGESDMLLSLYTLIVVLSIPLVPPLLMNEGLYTALRKFMDFHLFLITIALPWLAEDRERQFLHVAIAQSGIILAKDMTCRKSTPSNARESTIMIPFDQITCCCGAFLSASVTLKIRIDESVGPDHLVAPVVIFSGLTQGEEFQRLISQLKNAATPPLELFASTSQICFTKLFSSFSGSDDKISPLWQTIHNELRSKEFTNQDLAVERIHQERERKRLECKEDNPVLSQDSLASLIQSVKWSDNFFAKEDDILAVFDIDYPRIKITRFVVTWLLILIIPASAIVASMTKGERVEWHRVFLGMFLQWPTSFLFGFLGLRLTPYLLQFPHPIVSNMNRLTLTDATLINMKNNFIGAFPLPWLVDKCDLRSIHVAVALDGVVLAKGNQFSYFGICVDSGAAPSRFKIAFDQIVDCLLSQSMLCVDGSVQDSHEARIILKTRPECDVKTSRLIHPELVIPRLKDGKVFKKLITAMKGQHPQQLAETLEYESTASINVEDLFGNGQRRDIAALPPIWRSILKETSSHSPEA